VEEKEIMSFLNETGEKVDFEPIAEIYLEEIKYLILSPVNGDEEDAFVFRVDIEDEKEVLNLVENDDEFIKVKKEYKSLLY
jgi:uncharacterized protein YrzB (UPF0473 family)